MKPLKKTLLALIFILCGQLAASAQGDLVTSDDPRLNEWLNLRKFGAVGDGSTNDGPALQAALNALSTAGGGTLYVPPGKYRIATTVSANFLNSASSVVIKGGGSASQLYIATGENANALQLYNAESLLIDDLVFVGNPEAPTDAKITLDIQGGFKALIRNTHFYGLISQVRGGSVVHAQRVDLRIEHSSFRGSSAAAGFSAPVVQLDDWRGLSVADVDFIDYGVLNGVYHSKTPFNPPNAWIQLNNTSTLDNALAQHEVVIERVRMDEGAYNGIFVNINTAQSDRLAHIKISGLRVNGTGLGGSGVWVQNARRVTIERSWFGYAGFPGTAVALVNVDNTTLRDVFAEARFDRIYANVGCKVLTLIDTTYGSLDSEAATTNIIRDGKQGVGKDPAEAVDVAGNVRATGEVSAARLASTAPQGTAPLAVTSTTLVPNLNADKLDGKESTDFAASNHTHSSLGASLDVTGNVRATGQLSSAAPQGTPPLAVASSTLVPNLNADKVDGKEAADFAAATHTHSQLPALEVTGDLAAGGQVKANAPQGTAPLAVTSTTRVPNLNADRLDGRDSTEFALANHTHTQTFGVASVFDVGDKLRIRKDDNLFGRRNFALELGRGQAIAFAGANSSAGGNYSGVLGQIGAFNAYYFSGDLLGSRMEFYNQSSAEWFKTGIKFYTSTDSAATATERLRIEPNGNVHVFGSLTKGSGTFLIDHPLYPKEKQLYHGFVEAPRYDLIYRGRVRLVKGHAVVSVDKDSNMSEGTFEALTQNPQIFVQNETGWEPVRAVLEGGKLKITSRSRRSNDTVGWLVVAERKDAFIKTVNNVDAQGRLVPEHPKK